MDEQNVPVNEDVLQLAPLCPSFELHAESSKTSFQAAENSVNQEQASALSREHLVPADHACPVKFPCPIGSQKESTGEVSLTGPPEGSVSGQQSTEPYTNILVHGEQFTGEKTLSLREHGLQSNVEDFDKKSLEWSVHCKQLTGGEISAVGQQSICGISDIKILQESVCGQQLTGEEPDMEVRDNIGKVPTRESLDDAHGQMRGEALDDAHGQMHGETLVDSHGHQCRVGEPIALCQHSTGGESDTIISDESGQSQQHGLQVAEDHRDCEEVLEMKQVAGCGASVSAKKMDVPGVLDGAIQFQDKQMEVVSEGDCLDLNGKRYLAMDGMQHLRAANDVCESVNFVMKEGCQGEASLEMLSVAVESLENMQRQSQEGSAVAFKGEEIIGAKDEHVEDDFKNAQMAAEQCTTSADFVFQGALANNSLVEDTLNIDSIHVPGEDIQNKTHFLNMLCELASVQQHEQEHSVRYFDQVAAPVNSFDTSILKDEAADDEPRRLSFVDLLRRQMVHAAAVSPVIDLTADAERFYEEFMRQNQGILGSNAIKEFMPSMPSTGRSRNDGFETVLKGEQSSSGKVQEAGESSTSTLKDTDDSGRGKAVNESGNAVLKAGKSAGDKVQEGVVIREGANFGVGDLVWAKVKSHPWWPGQIFDAVDASVAAKKLQRSSRVLVAFFGDGTFGWLQQSQLIAFRPNFEEKVKQTTMKSFCRAVAEALDEVCRRSELGLSCPHYKGVLHSKDTFPDANAGMQKGVRIKYHQDISMSQEMFKPERILEFVKTAACSPFHAQNFSLEFSELCGHAYGFRTFMFTPKKPNSDYLLQNMTKAHGRGTSARGFNMKRRFSSIETDGGSDTVEDKEAKRSHLSKDVLVKDRIPDCRGQSPRFRTIENLLSIEDDDTKAIESKVKTHEEVRGGTWLVKGKRLHVSQEYKGSKRAKRWHLLGSKEGLTNLETRTGTDDLSPDDDTETLLSITGYHPKLLKKIRKGDAPKNTTDTMSGSSEKVDKQAVEERQELKPNKPFSKSRKAGEDSLEGGTQDSGNSSLSTPVVPHHNLSVSADTKELDDAGETVLNFNESPVPVLSSMTEQEKISKGEKQTKFFHSHQGDNLNKFVKAKKTRDDTFEGERRPSRLHKQEGDDMKKPAKTVKLGDSIKHVAGEPTDTSVSMKSASDSSANKSISVVSTKFGMKKEAKSQVCDPGSSRNQNSASNKSADDFVQLLQGLQDLAKGPLSKANMKSSMHGVTAAFLKFRSMVFLKSSGYGTAEVGKTVSHFENGNFLGETKAAEKAQPGTQNVTPRKQRSGVQDSSSDTKAAAVKTQLCSQNVAPGSQRPAVEDFISDTKAAAVKPPPHAQNVTPGIQISGAQDSFTDTKAAVVKAQPHPLSVAFGIQRPGVQELAVAARKRKSEVVQEGAAKMSVKSEVTLGSLGQLSHKERTSKDKVTDLRHHGKNIKHHHSKRETFFIPDMKSPVQVSDAKVPETSLGLFMQFPHDFALPSEAQLKEAFLRFGTLETAGIRVYRNSSSAQVVFKHSRDAEAALKHARKNGMFGCADVSYKLRHFSRSSRRDTKNDTRSSAKSNSSERADGSKSSLVENLEGHNQVRKSSSSGTEPGGTGIPADSLVSHQQEAILSPSNHGMDLNATFLNLPSVSSVNVPSGDIQDQMMKLLQQVSVIVSSSSLTPKAT